MRLKVYGGPGVKGTVWAKKKKKQIHWGEPEIKIRKTSTASYQGMRREPKKLRRERWQNQQIREKTTLHFGSTQVPDVIQTETSREFSSLSPKDPSTVKGCH